VPNLNEPVPPQHEEEQEDQAREAHQQVSITKAQPIGNPRVVVRLVSPEQLSLLGKYTDHERSIIQKYRQEATQTTVVGQVVGRSPILRDIQLWAQDALHSSLQTIVHIGRGYFEATFQDPEGNQHAMKETFRMGMNDVVFAKWSPKFSSEDTESTGVLAFPIWVQFHGLNTCLRSAECLPIFAAKIGKVIKVEPSDTYIGKTAGLRVRILRDNIHDLPKTILIPRASLEEFTKHPVLYNELPDQCNRCRKFGHVAKYCDRSKQPKESSHNPEVSPPKQSTPPLQPLGARQDLARNPPRMHAVSQPKPRIQPQNTLHKPQNPTNKYRRWDIDIRNLGQLESQTVEYRYKSQPTTLDPTHQPGPHRNSPPTLRTQKTDTTNHTHIQENRSHTRRNHPRPKSL
jgi:hypothetical protein